MEMRLTPRDHCIVGLYSLLIFISMKYAVNVSNWGWFFVVMNVFFFDLYAWRRKREMESM